MKENIKGRPGNRKPDGRKVQSPNKKPNPVAYEYTDEEYRRCRHNDHHDLSGLMCCPDQHMTDQSISAVFIIDHHFK